ncbi:MAG: signal peptide peptidase SppA [Pseudomonadota bacterium]|nr:signal peptide peptidase SppA [Pseudomonadota bacterium]
MKFVRAVWKLMVGIKDGLVLIFMLLFFGLLYAGLSNRPAAIGSGVLDLNLKGNVVEQPDRAQWSDVAGAPSVRNYALHDLIAALDAAKDDGRVKAVALDLDSFAGGGQTAMIDVADAVRRVRATGKPVIAYATGYTDDSYQVAAAASEIWLNPLGAVLIAGPGGSNLYFKGLLDKLGVTANVYRVGTYKSAVEPYIRNDMSPEAKQNYQALGDAELSTWRAAVLRSRPKANVGLFLKDMNGAVAAAGGDTATAALNAGLVDKIGDRMAYEAHLAKLGGDGGKESAFKRIKYSAYVADSDQEARNAPIGVITIAGMIVDGKAGPGTAGSDTIARQIADAVNDGVKAIVLRVDSPGGSVTASERIRQSLLAAKARNIPVVVSMGNVAASGGYWVSTPADYIYAEPSTITGSIGVFGVIPSFQGALQKLGIGADGIKTTPLSGEPDLLKGPSPEVSQLIQTSIESTYRRFLAIVAQSRHKSVAQVDAIAQGRVWDGGTAHQLGLVDGFGGMSEAIAKAAELAKLGNSRGIHYYEPPRSLEDALLGAFSGGSDDRDGTSEDAFAVLAGRPEQQLAAAFGEVQAIMSGPTIQARCIECAAALPAPPLKRDLGFAGLVWSFLSRSA